MEKFNPISSALNLGLITKDLKKKIKFFTPDIEKFKDAIRAGVLYKDKVVEAIIENQNCQANYSEYERALAKFSSIKSEDPRVFEFDWYNTIANIHSWREDKIKLAFVVDFILVNYLNRTDIAFNKAALLFSIVASSRLSNETIERILASTDKKEWKEIVNDINNDDKVKSFDKGKLFKDIVLKTNQMLKLIPHSYKDSVFILEIATMYGNEAVVNLCLNKFLQSKEQTSSEKYLSRIMKLCKHAILRGNFEVSKAYLSNDMWHLYSYHEQASIIANIALRVTDENKTKLIKYLRNNNMLTKELQTHVDDICFDAEDQIKVSRFYADFNAKEKKLKSATVTEINPTALITALAVEEASSAVKDGVTEATAAVTEINPTVLIEASSAVKDGATEATADIVESRKQEKIPNFVERVYKEPKAESFVEKLNANRPTHGFLLPHGAPIIVKVMGYYIANSWRGSEMVYVLDQFKTIFDEYGGFPSFNAQFGEAVTYFYHRNNKTYYAWSHFSNILFSGVMINENTCYWSDARLNPEFACSFDYKNNNLYIINYAIAELCENLGCFVKNLNQEKQLVFTQLVAKKSQDFERTR